MKMVKSPTAQEISKALEIASRTPGSHSDDEFYIQGPHGDLHYHDATGHRVVLRASVKVVRCITVHSDERATVSDVAVDTYTQKPIPIYPEWVVSQLRRNLKALKGCELEAEYGIFRTYMCYPNEEG